ncbi:Sel1 domain protein repeat-containing protein [Ruminiclostridium papyrosolvens DSM 2782]|uniref:Sel1 domain protein repeat-containing protein n=1 Tax=Ruminiclostridium papyrosolvens DSM 2782 TaxID=588581 RepID=F1TII9_9FIRM|nr:MobP3 family relaxase [Ruminiclostridium papyrosolvens]EGD45806.1 Sel1 domain protein repeat-containing protein [Ruminiclostridium papyrosolvens DSM 2782]WES33875.1 MobP3 family relaxase [Ruminiclostridium papyrosolvens DSM 2782]
MPKIILRCNYLRDAPPEHLANYVKYIGTREGVEKVADSRALLPATVKQKQLISKILGDIGDAKNMHEYSDFLINPTRENASEFITLALENNLELICKRKNYVGYISNRPRVERVGEHGLFTDAGTPVILSQVAEEVANHKGNVWTHVISLRREDAQRLGYDRGKQWQELIRSSKAMLCKNMKIPSENIRWYCAFHNESHHPHVHLLVYSKNEMEGYLSKQGIQAMRSELAHSIFRQDFMNIYDRQNESRSLLKENAEIVMRELLTNMQSGTCENKAIEEKILLLSERLKNTSGKKQYGYLKADVKNIIDCIVDELEKDNRVAEAYRLWNEAQRDILNMYAGKISDIQPLSKQKQFKSIKNMVIAEALNIVNHHFTFEQGEDEVIDSNLSEQDNIFTEEEETLSIAGDLDNELKKDSSQHSTSDAGYDDFHYYVEWNERYKEARKLLYGSDTAEQSFDKAYSLFMEEAEAGNALAMYDIGRMHMDGLGAAMDSDAAQVWYERALISFSETEAEKSTPYTQYRIGKMFAAGLGTSKDYKEAADWLKMASGKNHKYAQYSLAGMYYHGHGVDQSYSIAYDLYRKSAIQNNPYASYELAKMLRDGICTVVDNIKADVHFQKAFDGFSDLEGESHDDKLQYRLGYMLYTGTGTEKNISAAIIYFEKSAKLGNVHAQYMLGKIYMEDGSEYEDIEKALKWLAKAADNGNDLAQYALGKLYHDGNHLDKNVLRAAELFTKSAEQENQYAAYALGRMYLANEDIPEDVPMAIKWLTLSSDLGNQFAQYTLAKLYLTGEAIQKDIQKAMDLLTKSALQNNQLAQYSLGRIYLSGEEVPKNTSAAVSWLTKAAEQDNQYAQYALGKLYLMGHDLPQDREKSIKWLTASAAQGNIYAQFLIDHIDSLHEPSVLLAATRLMHWLGSIFDNEQAKSAKNTYINIDRKQYKRLMQKKSAQGHAYNDHTPEQGY